ncbi:MAG: BlaI/MecI/CopY family transcriptional regulator [Terriglobales bacterium]
MSRREREILEILYRRERATAAEIRADMAHAPTYTTVRGLLRILERKCHVRHQEHQGRFVFTPVRPKGKTARQVLRHVVHTFFDGSAAKAVNALLGSQQSLSEEELARLEELIESARGRRR